MVLVSSGGLGGQVILLLVSKFGHCLVPRRYSAKPKLGQWVSTQRTTYRWYHEGKPSPMTAELIRELESIGFEWEINVTRPLYCYRETLKFKLR